MLLQVNPYPGARGALSTSLDGHDGSGTGQPWEQPSLATASLHPGLSASSRPCGFPPSAHAQRPAGNAQDKGLVPEEGELSCAMGWVAGGGPTGAASSGTDSPSLSVPLSSCSPCSRTRRESPRVTPRSPSPAPAARSEQPQPPPSGSTDLGAVLGTTQTCTTGRELRGNGGIKWSYSFLCLPPTPRTASKVKPAALIQREAGTSHGTRRQLLPSQAGRGGQKPREDTLASRKSSTTTHIHTHAHTQEPTFRAEPRLHAKSSAVFLPLPGSQL